MSLPNTHFGPQGIAATLGRGRRLHFIGIGGVHMSAMASFAAEKGFTVTGSDRAANPYTAALERAGIPVYYGHDASRVVECDGVIYTLAISPDNPEYTTARRLGVPVFSRADFLSFLMAQYPCRIGVAGSHGKSTVTAMLAEIFTVAGRDPTVFCGAPLCRKGPTVQQGKGSDAIFEACEYQDSFLCFDPTVAVILNAERDHVDYFQSDQALERSFCHFAACPGEQGMLICNAEDPMTPRLLQATPGRGYTFGIEVGDYHAAELIFASGKGRFEVVLPNGEHTEPMRLRVPGRHNVANAIAAFAVAHLCHVSPRAILTALASFSGAGRRMEYRGMLRGARVFDDYAHHPTEIAATLQTAREMVERGRVFAVFQSHTYSRTAAFFGEICQSLRLADRVAIAPIYPARETETLGMDAARLAAGVGECAIAPGDLPAIGAWLLQELCPGDLCVVMGAGNIDRIFTEILQKHFTL